MPAMQAFASVHLATPSSRRGGLSSAGKGGHGAVLCHKAAVPARARPVATLRAGIAQPLREFSGASVGRRAGGRRVLSRAYATDAVDAVSDAEQEANLKRQEEAGGAGNSDDWKWTLNWDAIMDNIIVGSCPRSAADMDRLVEEAGIEAIICLQSDVCFDALKIDHESISQRALEKGVILTRVAVRDFDHHDQAAMLPEAVRILGLLQDMGKKTYVHCTAGINRATLTVVGYLTFVKGMPLDEAVSFVKEKRPQAHPYVDCWRTARSRLLDGRGEELKWRSQKEYEDRCFRGTDGSSATDWQNAEANLLSETFTRRIGCDSTVVNAVQKVGELEVEKQKGEVSRLQEELEAMKAQFEAAQSTVQQLEARVAAVPQIEAERDALQSKAEAAVAEAAEATQEAMAAAQRAATAEALAMEMQTKAKEAESAMEAAESVARSSDERAGSAAEKVAAAEDSAAAAAEVASSAEARAAQLQVEATEALERAKAAETRADDATAQAAAAAVRADASDARAHRLEEEKAAAAKAAAEGSSEARQAADRATKLEADLRSATDEAKAMAESFDGASADAAETKAALARTEAKLTEQKRLNADMDERLMEVAKLTAATLEWRNSVQALNGLAGGEGAGAGQESSSSGGSWDQMP